MKHRVVEQRQHVEDRDDADQVRRQDEQEERQQQRRLGVDPLLADVRLDDVVAQVDDEELERVHEAGRDAPVLPQIPAHGDA